MTDIREPKGGSNHRAPKRKGGRNWLLKRSRAGMTWKQRKLHSKRYCVSTAVKA